MKKNDIQTFVLVLGILLLAACSEFQVAPTEVPFSSKAVSLTAPVTILPVLDRRRFDSHGKRPDLNRETAIVVPADQVIQQGREAWRKAGLNIKPYTGSTPEGSNFKWSDFPLYRLSTDLGLGLEIKNLDMNVSGYNQMLPAHALIDAALLPFFGAAVLITDGHFDLAGRFIPSSTVKFSARVDLHFISVSAGGHFFTKTYLVNIKDDAVSESELYSAPTPTEKDGQKLGRKFAPALISKVFTTMARDPELANIQQLVKAVWLSRALSDNRISPDLKIIKLNQIAGTIKPPDLSAKELLILSDSRLYEHKSVDQVWVQEERGRIRLFEAAYNALLKGAAALHREVMVRPLTDPEIELKKRIKELLSKWNRNLFANQLFRLSCTDSKLDIFEKQAVFSALAIDKDSFDNRAFVENIVEKSITQLKSGAMEKRIEAAFLLMAAKGDQIPTSDPTLRTVILKALSGEDQWAAPLIAKKLGSGDFDPELVRLAGALKITDVLPEWIRLLKALYQDSGLLNRERLRPVIPLYPTNPQDNRSFKPDPALIVKAMGRFKGNSDVIAALENILRRWTPGYENKLLAETILSLALLGDRRSLPKIVDIWKSDWSAEEESPHVRRAALKAITLLADEAGLSRILEFAERQTVGALSTGVRKKTALTETAEAFGEIGYSPAVSFLTKLAIASGASDSLRRAALQAMGLIASDQAEKSLVRMTESLHQAEARQAESALDTLARERAYRRMFQNN